MNHYGLEQTHQISEVLNQEIVLDQDDFKDKIEQVKKTNKTQTARSTGS